MQIVGALETIGDRAENAEPYAFGFRVVNEGKRFVDKLQVKAWIGGHLIQLSLLGLPVGETI